MASSVHPSFSNPSKANTFSDPQTSRGHSPSQGPGSSSKYYRPYFSTAEIDYLSEKQRGKQTATQEDKIRQNACAFIETMGARIGFPRRTTATAQLLYNRFNLFFPRKEFNNFHEVALAALYVSSKMHDTLKKPRELLSVSYAIRFPEQAAKSKHPGGEVDLDTMDPQVVEHERQRLLTVERLILETICFNFTSSVAFPYVFKIGKRLDAPAPVLQLAWRLCVDSYRTVLPLQYPPHTLALGGLYTATHLLSFERPPDDPGLPPIRNVLAQFLQWPDDNFHTRATDLEDIAHILLDLLHLHSSNPSANTSPSTPSSPSPHQSHRDRTFQLQQSQSPYKADQLIRLKIALREKEHPPRNRKPQDGSDPSALYNANNFGQNEGTTRFSFFPPSFTPSAGESSRVAT